MLNARRTLEKEGANTDPHLFKHAPSPSKTLPSWSNAWNHKVQNGSKRRVLSASIFFGGMACIALIILLSFTRKVPYLDVLLLSAPAIPSILSTSSNGRYNPAPVEAYLMSHKEDLELTAKPPGFVVTCKIWKDKTATPFYHQLQTFATELKDYFERIKSFRKLHPAVKDVRHSIREKSRNANSNTDKHSVCQQVELHPNGLAGIFQSSGQLSQTTNAGYIEPLLPPMRHPGLCLEEGVGVNLQKMDILLSLEYLIHDWGELCRRLKPHSRTIFVDMGASLIFHGVVHMESPTMQLLEQYRTFGIVFDHIYAYEVAATPAELVYTHLPPHLQSAFHWVNMGVSPDPNDQFMRNPFKMLLDNFDEDDLIVVKLDIDNPGIERLLVTQLEKSPDLSNLVDVFYFEHHVNQDELKMHWGSTAESVEYSFDLFHSLRKKGVAAHFWV